MQLINQNILPFENSLTTYRESDFFVGESSKLAYATIMDKSIDRVLYLYGALGSGKTHLSHIWAYKNSAEFITNQEPYSSDSKSYVFEDIDNLSEEDEKLLFHWYNFVYENNFKLLISGEKPLGSLNIKLPDLKSRLLKTMAVELKKPDDITLKTVFLKQLSDKQLVIPNHLIDYILKNASRSFMEISRITNALENTIPINLSNIKKII